MRVLYHSHYLEWFENLHAKLDKSSVVVLDNAPYHNTRTDDPCSLTTHNFKKVDIPIFLSDHIIQFDQTMLKPELMEVAGRHKGLPCVSDGCPRCVCK